MGGHGWKKGERDAVSPVMLYTNQNARGYGHRRLLTTVDRRRQVLSTLQTDNCRLFVHLRAHRVSATQSLTHDVADFFHLYEPKNCSSDFMLTIYG